jgi:hypothetical protein
VRMCVCVCVLDCHPPSAAAATGRLGLWRQGELLLERCAVDVGLVWGVWECGCEYGAAPGGEVGEAA